VGLAERDLELEAIPLRVDHHTLVVLVLKPHVSAGPEGDRLHIGTEVRIQQPLAGGDDRHRAGSQTADQLGLAAATFSTVPAARDEPAPTLTITPTSGSAIAASSAI